MNSAAHSRRDDPDTSRDAAARVDTTSLERTVVLTLRIYGPHTAHEIAELTGISLVSVSPRMKQLEQKGLITRGPDKRDNRTVWRCIDVGQCTHPADYQRYDGEQSIDLFGEETLSLFTCRVCGSSFLRESVSAPDARQAATHDKTNKATADEAFDCVHAANDGART